MSYPDLTLDTQEIHDRLVRLETRLVRLMLHLGADPHGVPTPARNPSPTPATTTNHHNTHWTAK